MTTAELIAWRKHAGAAERAYQHWCRPQYDNERRLAAYQAYLLELRGEELAAEYVQESYQP